MRCTKKEELIAYVVSWKKQLHPKSVCPIPHRMRLPPAQAHPPIWQQSLLIFSSKNSKIKNFGTETNTKFFNNLFLINRRL